jgi:uncharacterized protein (DUF433 family)
MNLPDFLVELPGNEITLKGSRIGLYSVIYGHREQGFNAEQLHEEYPTLSVELLNKVLEFYRQNRDEVDEYVRVYHEELDRQQATTPRVLDWEDMRRRWDEMRRAESR